MMMMMMAFCWLLIFQYHRYNKKLSVSEEKQALAVSISHQQQEESKPCSGLSKFSWNWQHHQCNIQNVRWEPVELRGDCREGSGPLGLWFPAAAPRALPAAGLQSLSPVNPSPIFLPCKTPMDCLFWTGDTQYHSTKPSFSASVLIQKKKIKLGKI